MVDTFVYAMIEQTGVSHIIGVIPFSTTMYDVMHNDKCILDLVQALLYDSY